MIRTASLVLGLLMVGALAVGYWTGTRDRDVSPWFHVPDDFAASHNFEKLWIDTGDFDLLTYRRYGYSGEGLLVVYIEGDGRPWITTTQLSDDPSPHSSRVLELAAQDSAAYVAYLARPCFYLPPDELEDCAPENWSLGRYGEDVVEALDFALDVLKSDAGAGSLRLVGVSGGGTLAALLAARRDDVVGLITVAANLDHDTWTERLGVTPLATSLNAADVAAKIEQIPQVHYIGGDDNNVMRADVDAYIARMDDASRSHVVMVPGRDHACCWDQGWRDLLARARNLMTP